MVFLKPNVLRFKFFIYLVLPFGLCSCQLPYLVKTSYNHLKILSKARSIDDVLEDKKVSKDTKEKLRLTKEAKKFAKEKMGLNISDSYSNYVQLNQPYVSYVLSVSPEYKLKHHTWSFPFVGDVPYKGYPTQKGAQKEAEKFPENKYDTYIRGVSAYSTLGWLEDPLLSSMIDGPSHRVVNIIIHEAVHATLYIKDHANFNERLATFIGNAGARHFYEEKEGQDSPTLKKIRQETYDDKLFSEFISEELDRLKKWYQKNEGKLTQEKKTSRLQKIQKNFKKNILAKMKTQKYKSFLKVNLNNAYLLSLKTYVYDLSDFQKLYEKFDRNLSRLIQYAHSLEDAEDPEAQVKKVVEE